MVLDANILLYAVDASSDHHATAATWLTQALNGRRRIAIPAQSVTAFVRIATHPRVSANPLTGSQAWGFVSDWLAADPAWVPPTSERTLAIFGEILSRNGVTGNLATDALLAAHAVEHGLPVVTADSDFARFPEVETINPLVG